MKPTTPKNLEAMIYTGPIMNPLLRAGDGIHVFPYNDKEIRQGDGSS
jgi:hypothetical protein